MERINVAELAAHVDDYVRRASSGESFEIVSGGSTLAELRPIPADPVSGTRQPPSAKRWRDLIGNRIEGPPIQETLDELREDRI